MKPSEPGLERQDFGPRMCDARVKKKKNQIFAERVSAGVVFLERLELKY